MSEVAPPGDWHARADRLAARFLEAGDPTGWFEPLYRAGRAGEVPMPWDRREGHWVLTQWAQTHQLDGRGKGAIVVGCGLGADVGYLASLGFHTVGFDVSDEAVREARQRTAQTGATIVQADLFATPPEWRLAFDLVVEVFTVQALPLSLRSKATAAVAQLLAPGGTLLVVAAIRVDTQEIQGPPWPFTRTEIESFSNNGLVAHRIDQVSHPENPAERRWRAEFHRPA